jgi:hypothetical protein
MSENEVLEQRIERALERQPQVVVPVEFAARVARALPARSTMRGWGVGTVRSAGKMAAGVAAVLLAGALFVLAPHAVPNFSSLAFDLELVMLAELAAVAWVLSRMDGGRL